MPTQSQPFTSTSLPNSLYSEIADAGEYLGREQGRPKPVSVPEMIARAWAVYKASKEPDEA